MTLKEWSDFNKGLLSNVEWIICILNHSFANDAQILETVMRNEWAISLFGSYEVKRIRVDSTESGYHTLKFILWPSK